MKDTVRTVAGMNPLDVPVKKAHSLYYRGRENSLYVIAEFRKAIKNELYRRMAAKVEYLRKSSFDPKIPCIER